MPDYGMGLTNIDKETGIRYGVISQHEVLQAWADSSEAYYGKPEECECPNCGETIVILTPKDWGDEAHCSACDTKFEIELPDCADPISHFYDEDGYSAECGETADIFIMNSPYYTYGPFCSPCAPGAVYLADAHKYDETNGIKAYCFSGDWFDDGKAPYKYFDVKTNEEIKQ